MRILLTNDDGIEAPGIIAMWQELTQLGEVDVVAPETVQSASGHGITLSTPLTTNPIAMDGGYKGIAVDGRPADCVKLAISKLLPQRPDLCVSGMNSGANVGINVIYSGTVAAAIEAAFLGVPAIAVSLHLLKCVPIDNARAAKFARQTIQSILKIGIAPGQVITINIPALMPEESPRGVKVVRQCVRPWMDTYEERQNPRGQKYFWNSTVYQLGETEADTDVAALREKYITVTPLQFDLTDHSLVRKWEGDWSEKTSSEPPYRLNGEHARRLH